MRKIQIDTLPGAVVIVTAFTLYLAVLKLTGLISWSWLFVLAPIWIGPVAGFVCLIVIIPIAWAFGEI